MFNTSYQSDIIVYGFGDNGKSLKSEAASETFLWVLRGGAKVKIGSQEYDIKVDDTLLVPGDATYSFKITDTDTAILSTHMEARNRSRVGF